MLAAMPVLACAQSAAILPNARTQFIDANGSPVVGGTVGFYIPNTLTPKGTWQNLGETTPNTNPVVLDGLGSALIWGSGAYREILKNSSGSVIWDGVTSSNASGTVTSVTCGTGLTGGTITTNGTCALDTTRIFTSSASGLVPLSGGGTTNFLRADGTFASISSGYATIYDVAASYGGDPSGSSDSVTPFNNALSACSSSGRGGILLFVGGTWRWNSGVISNVSGCKIYGVGSDATIFKQYFAGDLITVSSQFGGVSNIQFAQSGAMSSGFGIVEEGFNNVYDNIYLNGLSANIHITNSSESAWTNIYERNTTGAQGILCDNSVGSVFGVRFDHVSSEGLGNTSYTHFTQGTGCNTMQISRTYGGNGANCVQILGGSFFVAEDIECDHNQEAFFINGGTGIQVSDSFIGSGLGNNGFDFSSGFAGFATITNNHIRDNLNAGIFLGASGGVSIVGNVISGNGTGGINVTGGVSNFNINNNQIGVPGDPTQADCVSVATGASNYYTITNNVCGSTNSSGVIDGGSGSKKTVTGNVGP